MVIAAVIISVMALLFTVFSFWWMNWRPGKLRIGGPRSYAASCSMDGKMVLEFPFVFFNSGPIPIFVQNLQVVLLDESPAQPLVFVAEVKKLGTDEDRSFATQFPIPGREATLRICEFQRSPGGRELSAGTYPLELRAILDDNGKWVTACRFTLNVTDRAAETIGKRFIVHDNMT